MTEMTPAEVTAQAEPVANTLSGTYGGVTQSCTAPRSVQYCYDDPLTTPVTDLTARFLTPDNAVLAQTTTYKPMNFGAQDGTESVLPNSAKYGLAEQPDLPRSPLTIDTGDPADIQSAADEAWELEQDIVGKLWDFETSMKAVFGPYVEEWKRSGWSGAAGSYANGIGKGIQAWWEGESEFWGSAWGWLKSTTASVGAYVYDGATNGPIPSYMPNSGSLNLGLKMAGDVADGIVGLFEGVNVMDFIEALHDLMRAFLFGDIDGIIAGFKKLTGLKDIEGAIGEFGRMIADVLKTGVDTMRDMIELIRRTPLLGLISSTFMRVALMMTPNFWAELAGEGVGFIIPELIIWAVTALIAALSAGAGASVIAVRAANIARKIRQAIKGGSAVGKILSFMDSLWAIIQKIKDMGLKLRRSIEEIAEGVVDVTQRKFLESRIWRRRLKELASQGHGPQKHEGDVTDAQLFDRVFKGIDPETGTIRRNAKGEIVGVAKHSTKFVTPGDYVRAYDKALEHPDYMAFLVNNAEERAEIILDFTDVFGPRYQSRVRGYTRVSGKTGKHPTIAPTQFTQSSKIVVRFRRENGNVLLTTMYPFP